MRNARSRRNAVSLLAHAIFAGLVVQMSRALASDKVTKAQAEYQDTPQGLYSCAMCTLFVAPNACKVVEGEISRDGWCKAFALAD
jgi:hypothetical protein